MKNLVTSQFHAQRANDFLRSFANSKYYFFVGDHVANPSDTVASELVSAPQLITNLYDNMIQGKKIASTDVILMVPRVVWETGTVYDQYTDLSDATCHVVVEDGSYYNVYKCLDNNDGAESTYPPEGTDAQPVTTSDGYVWTYLYGVLAATYNKFVTSNNMPYVANTTNIAAAVGGAVEVIDVTDGGLGYGNYFSGQLRSGDDVSNTQFKLLETASNINDFYNGCIIKITDPDSPAVGEFRVITDYVVSGSVKTITIASAFTADTNPTDTYEIYPRVIVDTENAGATECVAWAVINPMTSNSVSSVEVLSAGANIRVATAEVHADPVVSVVTEATLRPVISPVFGHGGDPLNELGSVSVGIHQTLTASDTDVPSTNDFRTFGVIKDPKFDNVVMTASGTAMTAGESIVQFETIATFTANAALSSTSLVGNTDSTFLASLRSGDSVRVANATVARVTTIDTVANNTHATTVSNVGAVSGTLSLIRLLGSGVVRSSNSTVVTADSMSPTASANSFIYGTTSHLTRTITAATFNGKSNTDTFVQATKLFGSANTGTLVVDEVISQANGSAVVHSIVDHGNTSFTIFATNVEGTLTTGNVTGATSGAVFNVSTKYNGDLARDSGQLMYAENVVPINRANNKTETIKLVLEL